MFEKLECVVQDCPQVMRKDLQELFPEQNIRSGPFTVITISQHTHNDMSSWNQAMMDERVAMLDAVSTWGFTFSLFVLNFQKWKLAIVPLPF
jgi:hypothetical protein